MTRRTLYLILAALDIVSATGAELRGQRHLLAGGLLIVAALALFVALNSPKEPTR